MSVKSNLRGERDGRILGEGHEEGDDGEGEGEGGDAEQTRAGAEPEFVCVRGLGEDAVGTLNNHRCQEEGEGHVRRDLCERMERIRVWPDLFPSAGRRPLAGKGVC